MQMRRLLRRDKELLGTLNGDAFTEVPTGTPIAAPNNLVAHKLAVRARTVDKRGRSVLVLKLTQAGTEEKAALSEKRTKYAKKTGWLERNQPVEAE